MIGELVMVAAHDRPAGFWLDVWERLLAESTAGAVFCDGSVESGADFVEMMSAGHVHPFVVFCGGDLGAIVWLTNLEGRMCRGHFCVMKKYWGVSRYFGEHVLTTLLSQKYENGTYCFDVIVGMIPKINIRAINVAKKSGFVYSGVIPSGAWIKERGISVDMVVLSATREV
jgi:hypothetical protein